ncbi:hypothetical protein E4U37_001016 [Claviceps purpurea]|nr:hypothetical protein E4U37_001016 [Claviceps purpurea]
MHAQMLQKACARAKPEVHKTGVALQNYFRHFSTSNRLTTDDDNNTTNAAGAPRPTPPNSSATQRSRAATREISNFLKGRGRGSSENAPSSSPLSQNASLSKPRVIDVRSLPRSLGSRGRTGTFRSRFGQDGQQGQQQQSGGNYTGQSSSPSSSFGAGGSRFSRGPGGAKGAKGGRGGRAGRGGRFDRNNSKRDGDGEAGDKKDSSENTTRREVNLEMDEEEVVFDRLMRFHSTTEYQPAFSLQSLVEYAPSFPSGEAGRTAIALEKLQEVGGEISTAGGVAGSAAVENDVQQQKQDQDQNQIQDKTTVEAAAAEGSSAGGGAEAKTPDLAVIKGVDDAVLEKIYEQAVQGKHEKMEFGTGPMATSRNLHLRTGTWNGGAMEKFEGKLKALVGGAKNSGKKAEVR